MKDTFALGAPAEGRSCKAFVGRLWAFPVSRSDRGQGDLGYLVQANAIFIHLDLLWRGGGIKKSALKFIVILPQIFHFLEE